MAIQRPPITDEVTERIIAVFRERLTRAFEKHGRGACATMHEAKGVIDEEVDEVSKAMHANDVQEFSDESFDVMIAGFWSAASVEMGVIDGKWEKNG